MLQVFPENDFLFKKEIGQGRNFVLIVGDQLFGFGISRINYFFNFKVDDLRGMFTIGFLESKFILPGGIIKADVADG